MNYENIKFEINAKTKKRAKKRRIKNEKKWIILRVVSWVSFIVSIGSLVLGELFVDESDERMWFAYTFLFAAFLMVGICSRALIANMSSHWIEDRLNEKIWVRDGYLYQFIQKAFSGGLNYRRADERATVYAMDLSQIRNAKYDPKSGRIEFNTIGKGLHYADYQTGKIDEEWELPPQFTGLFYDYTTPSLYEYLVSQGVKFEHCTINFKIFDGRI